MTRPSRDRATRWLRARAGLAGGVAGAVVVVVVTWLAGLDAGHVLVAAAAVVGVGAVVQAVQGHDEDLAGVWPHRPETPSAAGVRTDVERLSRRVPADVDGHPQHVSAEALRVARELAATHLARAGLDPARTDDVAAVLGKGAATVLTGSAPHVRTKDLRLALDRLATLSTEPAPPPRPSVVPAPSDQQPTVRSTP